MPDETHVPPLSSGTIKPASVDAKHWQHQPTACQHVAGGWGQNGYPQIQQQKTTQLNKELHWTRQAGSSRTEAAAGSSRPVAVWVSKVEAFHRCVCNVVIRNIIAHIVPAIIAEIQGVQDGMELHSNYIPDTCTHPNLTTTSACK